MRVFCLCVVVGAALLRMPLAAARIGKKCVVMEEFLDNSPILKSHLSCDMQQYFAQCYEVIDFKEDLAEVPSHLQTLCIENKVVTTVLQPHALSRFTSLRQLRIDGCLTRIHPGAFHGLASLQYLTIYSLQQCNTSFETNTFTSLPGLVELQVCGFRFLQSTPSVFNEFPLLSKLTVMEDGVANLADVLCRIQNLTSLQVLMLELDIKNLTLQNCTTSHETDGKMPTFFDVQNVSLVLDNLENMEKGALGYFSDVFVLMMSCKKLTLTHLLQSGLRSIHKLQCMGFVEDFEMLCKAAFAFSIQHLTVDFLENLNISVLPPENCKSLKVLKIGSITEYDCSPNSDFIHFIKNLSALTLQSNLFEKYNFCQLQTEPVALTSLDMSFNLIKNICAGQFSCMPSLIDLDLSNNQISTIEEHAFKGLLRLRSLNLQHNKISVVEKHRFEYLRNLKSLSMDWNPLTRIEEGAFENQVSLEDLSLGNLETLVSMLNLTSLFKRLPENLTDLSINVGRGSVHIAIGGDSHPSAGLTLSLRGRSVSFVDCHRPFFEHVIEVHAKTEQLRCGSDFMAKYVPNVKDFEYISELSATFIDYTDLNSLTKLRRLILVNINLFEQPNLPLIFRNLSQLETLVMVNCRIPSLEISLTKDLTSLKSFALHIANPVSWGNGLFDAVADLKFLYLIHLNVYCLCENAWFVTWAKAQTGLQALVWKPDLQDVTCPAAKGTANFLQFVQGSCVFETEFILFVSTACGLLFFMSAVLIYNLAGAYLLALFYILRGWLANLTRRGDAGRRYQFDAFVSYCGKDEDWVLEELLPNLEQRGPPFLRLCLHSRDFQPGKDVVDNITDSIYSSRRTLCVVSRHSLQSGWCSLEMRLATYRLQVERRDVLMLLFLEEIPPVLLSAHHRLARLVKTRTYLDWPQDERQRPAFWDRLQAKIASGRPTD